MNTTATEALDTTQLFTESFWSELLGSLFATLQVVVLRIIYALIIFLIGYIIIKIIMFFVRKAFRLRKFDETLVNFLCGVIGFVLKVLLFTAVIDALGLELLSLAALIGALGIAVGFAVGGLMANFVAGVLLLTRKPFVKGDYIEAQGVAGSVAEIDMFKTTLYTPDNKVVFVPNLPLATESLTNYSKNDTRRVDLVVGVAYDADLKTTKKLLERVTRKHPLVLRDPAINVQVSELGDSAVSFIVRPWVKKADYWTVFWDLTEQFKLKLDEAGIGIPFPQRDVHVFDGVPTEAKEVEFSETESEEEQVVETTTTNGTGKKIKGAVQGVGKRAKKISSTFTSSVKKVKGKKKGKGIADDNE